ncbi:MAG: bifunctional oligoribonuclease/PAP phosphatase NrnA [Phycisphaerae bacterium]
MNAAPYHDVTQWIRTAKRPLLLTHRRPDGDALGGLLAMAGAVEALGAKPKVVLYEDVPKRYAFWRDRAAWHVWTREHAALAAACDSLIIVDTCSFNQLEDVAAFLPVAPRTLVIDHHATHDEIGTRDGDLQWIDPSAGAVCLLIEEWLRAAKIAVTNEMAEALFVGIGTDTGWFRFSNADARVFSAAARLVADGVESNQLFELIHEQEPAAKMRLMGRLLENMELLADERLAVLYLRQADFAAVGADETMTDELVNIPARIQSVVATVMITEQKGGGLRLNFRSKHTVDVAAIAQEFGGGGHERAAGARAEGQWDEAVAGVVRRVKNAVLADLGGP